MENLPYNIESADDRLTLTTKVRQWIVDGEVIHRQMISEWNDIEDRLNSEFSIAGFRTDPLGQLEEANLPSTNPAQTLPLLMRVPRSRPNHESILGNFVGLERKLAIKGRTPRDKNLARIIRERIRYIEDTNSLKENVYFPMMDGAFGKGLHWLEVRFNGKTGSVNKFEIDEVSARDVLVDPRSRGQRFKTGQWRAKRFLVTKEDAAVRFAKYPFFDVDRVIISSADYDKAYPQQTGISVQNQGTFYRLQFWMMMNDYVYIDPQTREPQSIDEATYQEYVNNPETAQFVLSTPEEKRYFEVLFEEGNGVFHFDHIEPDMFLLIPCENIRSEARLYPYGDPKMYQQLEDLLSVLVTVFLDNAKRANYPIAKVDPQLWEKYSEEIARALEEGGAAPGIENVYSPAQINNTINLLIGSVIGWIQDASSQHAASMGELPAKQIAEGTVDALIAKDRQSHGRKDIMIDATLTDLAKLLVKMITLYDTDEDIIPIEDPKARFQYLPINKILTETEYQKLVIELSELPMPSSQEEEQALMQQIPKLMKQFEYENDVKVFKQNGYVDEQGGQYMPEQIAEMAQEEQKSDQPDMRAFFTQHPMQEAPISVYYVNVLTPDINLSIRYGIETDFASDPQYVANRALTLNQRGAMSKVDMLEALQIRNPQEVAERAEAENQVMQMARQLTENPQLYQTVMAVMQQAAQQKEAPGATKQ